MVLLSYLRKETTSLFRDWHGIFVLFLMPSIFLIIMSLALQDTSHQHLLNQIGVDWSIDDSSHNAEFFRHMVQQSFNNGDDSSSPQRLAIQVHHNFADSLSADGNTTPAVTVTGSANISSQVWGLINGVISEAYAKTKIRRMLIDFQQISDDANFEDSLAEINAFSNLNSLEFNIQQSDHQLARKPSSVQQSVPAWLIFGIFFIVIPMSNSLLSERQNGIFVRLYTMQVSPLTILLGKLIPYVAVSFLQALIMTLIGILLLPLLGGEGLVLTGPLFNYAVVALLTGFCAIGLGLLISVAARSHQQATVLGGGFNIIFGAIGGIMVPKYVMPETMQHVADLSPLGWALSAFHGLLLQGQSLLQVGHYLLALLGFGLLTMILSSFLFQQELKGIR